MIHKQNCVPDVVKSINVKVNINVKVFNLKSRTNEAGNVEWHKNYKCKDRLDASACHNKQRWNNDECRCECKELIDKGICNKGFTWNPSNCECECDKSCHVREYLDYENCKCRKRLINKLVEECSENIVGNEMIRNDYENVCNFCTIYILFIIAFLITIGISSVFTYFHWYLKSGTDITNINPGTETITYQTYKWEISSKQTLKTIKN